MIEASSSTKSSFINIGRPTSHRPGATGGYSLMLLAPIALLSVAVVGWADPARDRLVVCSFRTGELELFAVDPVSGDAINLTRSPKSVEKYPACSYDGDQVAFISNRDGTDALYVMKADGSGVRH